MFSAMMVSVLLGLYKSLSLYCPCRQLFMSDCLPSASRRRWEALRMVVREKRIVRQLTQGLLDVQRIDEFSVKLAVSTSRNRADSVVVELIETAIDLNVLNGYNNTGNVCIWLSEEVMAMYCYENSEFFHSKKILEVGGGMTCVAGLVVSKFCRPARVVLSDGNEKSIAKLKRTVPRNGLDSICDVRRVDWTNRQTFTDLVNDIDVVLCADCLFFEGRYLLSAMLRDVLRSDGIAIVLAPVRHGTLDKFVENARSHFNCVEVVDDYLSKLLEKLPNDVKIRVKVEPEDVPWLILLKQPKPSSETVEP